MKIMAFDTLLPFNEDNENEVVNPYNLLLMKTPEDACSLLEAFDKYDKGLIKSSEIIVFVVDDA